MREIKFRAWSFQNKKIISVKELTWMSSDTEKALFVNGALEFPQVILMQFTGLKDKNGLETYEGDILKLRHYSGYSGDFVGTWNHEVTCLHFGSMFPLLSIKNEAEVIGNIYENPELIKETK